MAEPSQAAQENARPRRSLALAVALILFVGGAFALWQALGGEKERPPRTAAVQVDPTPGPPLAVAPDEERRAVRPRRAQKKSEGPPIRLAPGRSFARGKSIARVIIPAIGVRAPMIKLGLNPDDSLKVPADTEKTGWWAGGAKPGRKGTAVIVGHVDSQRGPAVFHRLQALSNGDQIKVIFNDGSRAAFVVTGRERVPKDDFPTERVYDDTSGSTVRLITCGGRFDESSGHYRDNVVVYGRAA